MSCESLSWVFARELSSTLLDRVIPRVQPWMRVHHATHSQDPRFDMIIRENISGGPWISPWWNLKEPLDKGH